jgi:hypothetical protein
MRLTASQALPAGTLIFLVMATVVDNERPSHEHPTPEVAMSPGTELPDIAAFLERLLQRVPPAQQPLLLATRERAAAERYRGWAREVTDPKLRAGLLACAEREDEIARRIEGLYPDAVAIVPDLVAKTADLAEAGRALFAGLALERQFAQQARGERCGAGKWRAFASSEGNGEARTTLLACALLEEESAVFLEGRTP